jgi:hypothetical protein
MKPYRLLPAFLSVLWVYPLASAQQVTVTIDAGKARKAVSPYIYGRNNTFEKPASFYKDAGLRFVRMNGGNNATKYNWRKKITSHPDWYNNVYKVDWDSISSMIAAEHPEMQAMWAFQLLGRVASSTSYNFNDWAFNQSKWWDGTGQNLAGGGKPDTTEPGTKAQVEGDINLYTQLWPADSSVAILDHWFGAGGLGLKKQQFMYWSMDNEPDIWNGTHDDVMPSGLLPAKEFMDRFIDLAKKARAKFPEIKICGPVTTSEWQWYRWGEESITLSGKYYCFLEYFIKRCAEEEKTSGIRVLDVVDLHNYPYYPSDEAALQLHRTYYDETYDYPGANGLKTINGGWETTQTKEYIFKRINTWLDKHYGENHGITLGISEWSPGPSDPNLASVIYASHLGVFANNGVDLFTPWTWFIGMWETLHLFGRHAKGYSVASTSSIENTVSAYTTVNGPGDSMTVIIVNRDMKTARSVTVNLNGFSAVTGNCKALQLSSLPATETFVSHTQNALKEQQVSVASNSFTLTVPALSTTAVLLAGSTALYAPRSAAPTGTIKVTCGNSALSVQFNAPLSGATRVDLYTMKGALVKTITLRTRAGERYTGHFGLSDSPDGLYLLKISTNGNLIYRSGVMVIK